jgi:hypothetical protein
MPDTLERSRASSFHAVGYCCDDCTNKDICGTKVLHLSDHANTISGSEMPDESAKILRGTCDCMCENAAGWDAERNQPSGSNQISWKDSLAAIQ